MPNQIGKATYRIGPADVFTGGDLLADAQTLQTQVVALDAQVEGVSGLSADTVKSWVLFQGDWAAFYASTFNSGQSGDLSNFLTALNDANRDQLIQFENRFADIAAALKQAGVSSVAADVAVSAGAPDTVVAAIAQADQAVKNLVPSLGIGLGTVVVLAVVVVVAWRLIR